MAGKITPGEWFLGTVETDRDEWGWDGCVWAPPTPEDIAAEQSPEGKEHGFLAEPALVAKVDHEPDARAMLALPGLLAACKDLLELWPLNGYELEAYCHATLVPAICAAVARTKKGA